MARFAVSEILQIPEPVRCFSQSSRILKQQGRYIVFLQPSSLDLSILKTDRRDNPDSYGVIKDVKRLLIVTQIFHGNAEPHHRIDPVER